MAMNQPLYRIDGTNGIKAYRYTETEAKELASLLSKVYREEAFTVSLDPNAVQTCGTAEFVEFVYVVINTVSRTTYKAYLCEASAKITCDDLNRSGLDFYITVPTKLEP